MRRAPHGSWSSPLAAGRVARAGRRLSMPRLAGRCVWWIESRPEEGGRQALMRAPEGARIEEVSPDGADVRSRVHEYGGGEYAADADRVFYVDRRRPGIQLRDAHGERPVSGSENGARHADLALDPGGRFLAAVEEWHPEGGEEPENRIVLFDLAHGRRRVLAEGHDFFACPRFAPGGGRVAWLAWDHPRMPWDGTELFAAAFHLGHVDSPHRVAGGASESVLEPSFSPAGRLTFVSDRDGWWNLHQEQGDGCVALCPRAAEFARPPWVLGLSSYGFVDERTLVCAFFEGGAWRIGRLRPAFGHAALLALRPGAALYRRVENLRRRLQLGIGASRPRLRRAHRHADPRPRPRYRHARRPGPLL